MTTEQTITEPVTPDTEAPSEDKEGPAELRAALKREQDANAAMRDELIESRLVAIGLTQESGLGKAIAKEYDGSLDQEAVTAYAAAEYSWEGATETVPPAVEVNEKLDALNQVSEPVTPAEPVDEARAATEKVLEDDATIQDAKASMNAKVNQYVKEHYPT